MSLTIIFTPFWKILQIGPADSCKLYANKKIRIRVPLHERQDWNFYNFYEKQYGTIFIPPSR